MDVWNISGALKKLRSDGGGGILESSGGAYSIPGGSLEGSVVSRNNITAEQSMVTGVHFFSFCQNPSLCERLSVPSELQRQQNLIVRNLIFHMSFYFFCVMLCLIHPGAIPLSPR